MGYSFSSRKDTYYGNETTEFLPQVPPRILDTVFSDNNKRNGPSLNSESSSSQRERPPRVGLRNNNTETSSLVPLPLSEFLGPRGHLKDVLSPLLFLSYPTLLTLPPSIIVRLIFPFPPKFRWDSEQKLFF